MTPAEIDAIAEAGTNVVLNPVGNLKTRSGIAPIRSYLKKGVRVALGCDNCSCSDSQNMFQTMKLFAGLAAVSQPEPGPPTAADAIRSATIGGARTAGLEGRIGALRAGMAADLFIVDLTDPSFVPLNSVARQIVFTESGRGVETVIVDGRVVIADRKITTLDERALREEVADLMKVLRKDIEAVVQRNVRCCPICRWRSARPGKRTSASTATSATPTTDPRAARPARVIAVVRISEVGCTRHRRPSGWHAPCVFAA